MLCIFGRLKKVLLLLVILLVTGCHAEYNVSINSENDIYESLNVTENNKELFDLENENISNATLKGYLETNLKWPTPVDKDTEINPLEPIKIEGKKYYSKSNISTDDVLGINYNNRFTSEEYKKSNILSTCYDYEYNVNNNIITLKTTSNFKCFNTYPLLDEAKFNLNTKCNVISSNSDSNKKNKYTWVITKENKKQINFSIDCNKKKSIVKDVKIPAFILLAIYAILVLLGILILRISYKIHNKI